MRVNSCYTRKNKNLSPIEFILGKIFSKQTFDEGLFVNLVINIEYNSLDNSFSSIKSRTPLIR